ncbi:helix-turn-helix transcriptional regulator [Burkholderia sp. L27(2015)]|uniref:helix-turn-helix domain-containing protein n=1 Tax=Burkholderia sp. L27(2015) TaxID=1641858 RepID=UPI00131AAD1A|nr:helix-turn-helix transcriptional regulator [Burkholderia sp. L27(2015)]
MNDIDPSISLNEFKSRVFSIIKDDGISISELARITGIKQPTLHKGLYGERELTFSNATSIGKALGLELFKTKKTNFDIVPVIKNLTQLSLINESDLSIWDEYATLDINLKESCIVVDQSLLEKRIAPKQSLLVINTKDFSEKNAVYFFGKKLSLIFEGGSRLGSLVEIIFRGTR